MDKNEMIALMAASLYRRPEQFTLPGESAARREAIETAEAIWQDVIEPEIARGSGLTP